MTMTEIAILRVINLSNSVWARRLVSKTSMKMIIIFDIFVVPLWAAWESFFHLDICDAVQSLCIEPQFGPAVEWCSLILIIVSCYTGIPCYTKRRAGRVAGQRNERRFRYDIATIRTCIIIIVAFVVCHLPFIVYVILIHNHILTTEVLEIIFYIQFHLFSQAGNPIIMLVTSSEFRKHVIMFIRFLFPRWCRRNKVEVPAVIALANLAAANTGVQFKTTHR